MATDDVHDLFDTGGSDESDEEERAADADETAVSAEWDEFRSMKESAAGSPAAAESTSASGAPSDADSSDDDEDDGLQWGRTGDDAGTTDSAEGGTAAGADGTDSHPDAARTPSAATDVEDGGGEPGAGPTFARLGPSAEADRGRSERTPATSADEDPEDAAGRFEMGESATSGADGEGEFDPGASSTASGTTTARDADASGAADSTTRSERADPGERTSSGSSTSVDGALEGDAGDSGRIEPTSAPEPDDEDQDSVGSTSAGETVDDAVPAVEPAASDAAPEDVAGESASVASSASAEESMKDGGSEAESSELTGAAVESPLEVPQVADSDGPTVSADGSSTDDRGAAGTDAATPATDAPSVDDRAEPGPGSHGGLASGASGTATDEPTPSRASPSNRLPTGIDVLDEAMGGGVPPGRLVVLVSDPGVQSELIVDSVLAQRDTLYVTTDRPDWEVQKDIEPGIGSGDVVIHDHSPDSLLSGLDSLLDELDTSSNFVLDSVNELELVPRKRYRVFLSDVKQRLFDTGSIGLLTGVTVDHESARDLTLRRADIVLRLETRTKEREIVNLLSVPKFRGGAAMTETVKLELTDEVTVDTSWNEA